MGKKVRVNLTIDDEILKKAKDLGLNLSKVCENALIRAIEAMEEAYGKREPKNHPVSYLTNRMVDWDR